MSAQVYFGPFFGYFFAPFFCLVFLRFFSSFCGAFWLHFGFNFRCFSHQKINSIFDRFFMTFWMDFGVLNPWKWAPRAGETLIFNKSPFSILAWFWKRICSKKAPKIEPKWVQKSIKKSMHFFIEKSSDFGPKLELKWRQNGAQNRPKIKGKTECLSIPLQGG